MSNETWLVSLGAGRWQVPGIQAALEAGLKVLAIDADINAPGFLIANDYIDVDIKDSEAVINAIIDSTILPSGVISFCNDAGMVTSALVRDYFHLPGPSIKLCHSLTNKGSQRSIWRNHDLPVPDWIVCSSLDQLYSRRHLLKANIIIKPVDAAGSRGISVLRNNEVVDAAFDKAINSSKSRCVIAENYLSGSEFTVETFTHNSLTYVLAITEKLKVVGTDNTVASELSTAELSIATKCRIKGIVTKALSSLGFTHGPAHTELIQDTVGDFYLVETAGRGGGFMVADGLVPLASGFSLSKASALQAVGIEPELPSYIQEKSVVLRFLPSIAGKVMKIVGFDQQDNLCDVISEPMVSVGQDIGSAKSDIDRLAFILSASYSLSQARAMANSREESISFVIQ